MRAMRGAIDHVHVDPVTGKVCWSTIGSAPARGICGSGIIDLLLPWSRPGHLILPGNLIPATLRSGPGREGAEYLLVVAPETGQGGISRLPSRILTTSWTQRPLPAGRSQVLLEEYKCAVADIRHLYLAGAFGAYTDIANAVSFGILPRFTAATVHSIGNGSLSGAYATLVSTRYRMAAEDWRAYGLHRPFSGYGVC